MKRAFHLTSILLLITVLGSCTPDVFIDSCAPATDKMQIPAEGSAATLRFGSGNWYVHGLFLHVGYQLHDFKDPNNLMLGLGWRFGKF